MNLAIIIKELLIKHNCVIIPDFGGFIASQKEAKIDFNKGIIAPPSKQILFNKNLINNDGLLIHSFSNRYSITYEEALKYISNLVSSWNLALSKNEKINLPEVGCFYLNEESNLIFEQDLFFNLLLSSFGMSQVDFYPVQTDKVEVPEIQKVAKIIQLESEFSNNILEKNQNVSSKIIKQNFSKKLLKYAAAACLLPIAFYSVWIPVKTDFLESGVLFLNDFNPFHKPKSPTYEFKKDKLHFDQISQENELEQQLNELPSSVEYFSYQFSEDLFIPVKIKNKNTVDRNKSQDNITNSMNEAKNNSSFKKVIVGSFSVEQNAQNVVKDLISKGFSAFVLNDNAKFRVVAAQSSDPNEITNSINKLKSLQINSWILN